MKNLKYVLFPAIGSALMLGGMIIREMNAYAENGGLSLPDKPIQDYQDRLIDLAFEAASAIPVSPHIKDRSKAQQKVVEACLELDQPDRALAYNERIENWRKGLGYADLAFYRAGRGDAPAMQRFIDLAAPIADQEEDWRRDRIRVRIAQAYAWLGQIRQADPFLINSVDSEWIKVESVKAMRCDHESFDDQVQRLDSYVAQGNFDLALHSLEAYVQLFNRFYGEKEKRSLLEHKIRTAWEAVPVPNRIDMLEDLADFALEHSDPSKAFEFIDKAQEYMDRYQWRLERRLPLTAKIIRLRHRAGDSNRAHSDADAAWNLFLKEGEAIVNIWRSAAILPLAEAFQSLKDQDAALAVYKRAVEEGVANPNSRPRAEDLSAACCSMALSGCEPDEELWKQIDQIYKELGQPW
ncbi:MAG: hypothetical protein JXR73_07665 [Candidatus Omnitrophica bacterium]|nr:hypothetical protein [Candidatus Omnitrophota bacterium]